MLWKCSAAGETMLCEEHFREYRRKFAYLASTKPLPKPNDKFSDNPDIEDEIPGHSQLEM